MYASDGYITIGCISLIERFAKSSYIHDLAPSNGFWCLRIR
jgi:hypothetical protein